MSFRRSLLLAAAAAALTPSAGHAADVRILTRDVAVGERSAGVRSLAARPAPITFDMVGLHWRGPGRVWFRTKTTGGPWSSWQPGRPEAEDRPDSGTGEARAAGGWKLGNPYWTGESNRIQYRIAGRVTRLRAFFIVSPIETVPRVSPRAGSPSVIRRSQWGADESIVRAGPSYADGLRFAVVHHTAGTNSYSRAESAAIVRGIQRYHVLSNRWNDIGYNFLVDKYGQVFEGRGGGVTRNVVGAHAGGFNTGSVGVAVLGTYSSGNVSSAGRSALVKLLAWRLDVGHVDPASKLDYVSYGNERFAPGTTVRLRAVSGHRDTGSTSCPGSALYGQLAGIASAVASTGLPKLYAPTVAGSLGGPVRFTARLSAGAPWSVAVTRSSGAEVARGTGTGTSVDWTWDSSAAPWDRYSYTIAAGSSTRPAAGRVPGPPPLAVTSAVSRRVITPNGDGASERLRLSLTPNVRAALTASVLNGSGGVVKTLVPAREVGARSTVSAFWDGTTESGSAVAEGSYRIRIEASADSQQVVRLIDVVVDRTLGGLGVTGTAFSPNGDGRSDELGFGFELSRVADVAVHVVRGSKQVRRILFARGLAAGAHQVAWNGVTSGGERARDGDYKVRVRATTALGTRTLKRSFTVDTVRPGVKILWARGASGGTRLKLELGEAARLQIKYTTGRWSDARSVVLDRPPGRQRVWRPFPASRVRVIAVDAAANTRRAGARVR